MIVEHADTLGAVDQSLDIYNRAHEPKKLVLFHGGHLDAYERPAIGRRSRPRLVPPAPVRRGECTDGK
jgi:hypothetical protein